VPYSLYKYELRRLGVADDKTYLFQVRISEEEKRRIKTLAASQGMTLRTALTEAFAAWAKELKIGGAVRHREANRSGKKKG
jgi:hypothetical protein